MPQTQISIDFLHQLAELMFSTVTYSKHMGRKIIVISENNCTSTFYLSDDETPGIIILRSDKNPAFLDLYPIELCNPNFDLKEWFKKQNII